MFIESAQAMVNLVDICKSASQLTEGEDSTDTFLKKLKYQIKEH